MEGITNLRSLGGYRNKNQQVIKDGLIYRSGQLDQLTPAQTQYQQPRLALRESWTCVVLMSVINFQMRHGHTSSITCWMC
ncbi:hypothetical protein Nizo1839_3025 [Lactiplantibacillus plantarum]|nr:hypothetical protein FD10_GL002984 [Lactiplantibacillus argentoratensis DSM 16365]KTF02235.1 hypothetical protein SF2A35B_1194 [Lactiplantibacillus plantarum]KZT77093.1 hypothetical protein Nizo1839_3025 [Lactiplantibacillus plantarum]GEK62413.1 hypothetical protein LJA01_03160 [Lactobacillus japonicus]